jgi:hypothetical protein
MRETYTTLLQTSQDFCIDDSTTSTNALSPSSTFLARQLNSTVQYLHALTKNYKTQPLPRTFSTVADQVYYHYPPDLLSMESLTLTVGGIPYTLRPIHSQEEWNHLQELDVSSSTVPQYFFPRQSDFGIYPTPADVYTGTLVGNFFPQRLSVADYVTGTVAVAQNSQTVTGTSTTFTAAMVGRWFAEADSNGLAVGKWYRISAYSSATSITLESFFEESALSGSNFIIGQSPEIPEELHEFIPYRTAAVYYSTIRRDAARAQELLNFFYTGDFGNTKRGGGIKGGVLGVINEYKNKGRANSQIAYLHKSTNVSVYPYRNEAWITTLS